MPRARMTALAAVLASLATTLALGSVVTPTAGSAAAAAPTSRPDCGGERPLKPGGGRYTCTFEDGFSGSSLDSSKWVVQETALSGMTTANSDCYLNTPRNVSVGGGLVRLRSHVEPEPFTCRSPYGDFTATRSVATIASWNRFAQTYGRFEFRAKFSSHAGPGLASGLWMYPQRNTYGGWPNSGEIDVAEWFSSQPDQVYPSVHYSGEVWGQSTGFNCPVAGAGDTFHRYAVEWTTTQMRFLYDGRVCFTHSWTPAAPLVAPQPFDHPFYLVVTQAFGAGWNAADGSTPTSGEVVVDWVRAWR